MSDLIYNILAVVLSLTILYGIHLMNSPKTAVKGNQIGAVAMVIAIVITLFKDGTLTMPTLWVAMAIGSAIGLYCSIKVKMIQMPQYVALLNGFGGAASALVALMVLVDSGAPTLFSKSTAGLALLVGIITLTGSLVAAGKLHQVLAQKPVVLKNHSLLCNGCIGVMLLGLIALSCSTSQTPVVLSMVLLVLGGIFGILFTIRVGGADMPVTISLLNSLSGVAGAIAGLAIADPLLVAVGGIVGASGLLLTQIMCRAMNRSLMDILLGKTSVSTQGAPKTAAAPAKSAACTTPTAPATLSPADIVRAAKKVIIIPGYGMALAQAQHKVKALAESFEAKGVQVDYAIHPVAGRMPGHMNVLLAEAGVDYEKLLEMDDANPLFPDTDLAIIVGANDVINPAAREAEGTPIYGMPILDASKAKHIIVCNYDLKPGYAGVENPLYTRADVTMLLGDANDTVDKIAAYLHGDSASAASDSTAAHPDAALHGLLHTAQKVIIIPGYGMALAQAQHKVKSLAESFEAKGVQVDYAIHPVAGRMPGHMNVLLAEAGVDYEKLLEMDAANPLFAGTDLVVIVGANDVVNPAAREAEGTPIYGMPILDANTAKNIIVCNYDLKPGYAGVDNPLYTSSNVTMLLGDANDSVDKLVHLLQTELTAPSAQSIGATGATALPALLQNAKKVIIIPGYGMALAQAQHKVKSLAESFEAKGAQVDYAIHPVAGRMPGHMNVLLAEAGVDYEKLLEMDAANPLFEDTDLVVIVGANDVVNPAAREAEGTPIYGMPILDASNAKNIVICNFDLKPGYAGVDNPLYTSPKVTMLLGDANTTVDQLIAGLSETVTAPAACSCGCSAHSAQAAASQEEQLASLLKNAQKVMIIPGYGMALAQAQHKVKALADKLEAKGATVDYAIHPVAGRMPGHMNVLLAEADVDYEKLLEMDAVNPMFAGTDVAIVVGANDVINPAAIVAEGTPIYGMPILRVDEAKNIIICNYDLKPGYAGVENPLYTRSDVIMLLGDANDTVAKLVQALG